MKTQKFIFICLAGIALICLAGIAWFALSNSNQATFTAPPLGEIVGTVLDAKTDETLADAEITGQIEGHAPSLHAKTDAAGRFILGGLEPGKYQIEVRKNGYVRQQWGAMPGHGFGKEIVLGPASARQKITIRLSRGAGVSGYVYDGNGEPVARSYVFIDSPNIAGTAFFTFTDDHGAYRAPDLPPEKYYLSARRYSMQAGQVIGDRWYYPGVLEEKNAELIDISTPNKVVDIYFGKEKAPDYQFHVLGDDGVPLARAIVKINRLPPQPSDFDPESMDTLYSDERGIATARKLKDGEYIISMSTAPPPYAPWYDPSQAVGSIARYTKSITVNPNSRETTFVLHKGLALRGFFELTERARNLAGGKHGIGIYRFYSTNYPFSEHKERDYIDHYSTPRQNGDEFIAEGLVPGEKYKVDFQYADSLRHFCPVGLFLGDKPLQGDDLIGSDDPNAEPLRVKVDLCAVVSGTTTLRDKNIYASRVGGENISAKLYQGSWDKFASAPIVRGQFVFRGLPAGDYQIGSYAKVHVEAGETKNINIEAH